MHSRFIDKTTQQQFELPRMTLMCGWTLVEPGNYLDIHVPTQLKDNGNGQKFLSIFDDHSNRSESVV